MHHPHRRPSPPGGIFGRVVCELSEPKKTLRAQRLKNFKILKFSSQIEIFKRAAHQTPIFCGEFSRSGLKFSSEIEIFKRDWKFQSRLIFFNLWALWEMQNTHRPRFCTRDVDRRFCGGGAWISRSDYNGVF